MLSMEPFSEIFWPPYALIYSRHIAVTALYALIYSLAI
jgi:hypothetical protein